MTTVFSENDTLFKQNALQYDETKLFFNNMPGKKNNDRINLNFGNSCFKKEEYSARGICSQNSNGFINTKKLNQQFWQLNKFTDSTEKITDIDTINDTLVLANSGLKHNLQFFNLQNDSINNSNSNKINIKCLQTVSIPGSPITKVKLIDTNQFKNNSSGNNYNYNINDNDNSQLFNSINDYDNLILTGHLNGKINIISTNTNESKIIQKFNLSKYLRNHYTNFNSNLNYCKNGNQYNLPIQQIDFLNHPNYLVSRINDVLFIYNLNNGDKKPIFLNHYMGLQNFKLCKNIDSKNNILLTKFNSIDLLDFRQSELTKIFDINRNFYDCQINCTEILSDNLIAMGTSNGIKILDARTSQILTEVVDTTAVKQLDYNYEKSELNCLDQSGHVTKWDLNNISNAKMTLKMNSKSLLFGKFSYSANDNRDESFLENGDLILNNNDTKFLSNWKNDLITVGSKELGLHQIIDVRTPIKTINESNFSITTSKLEKTNKSFENELTKIKSVTSWNSNDTTPCNSVTSLKSV